MHGDHEVGDRGGAHARAGPRWHRRRTLAAWERFVSGEDDVRGVPPSILLSWHRCRDVHKVDPRLARPPAARKRRSHQVTYSGVFAQLGGIASSIVEHSEGCVATVTDGDGQIVACWGKSGLRHRAADSGLAPFFDWSEAATGTNGMGTAIMAEQPVLVRGPEHWCQSMHDWTCAGEAVYDAVTKDAVAALNICTSWTDDITAYASGMTAEMQPVRAGMREQALQDGIAVSREFMKAEPMCPDKLLAIDVAGNIIAGNEQARTLLEDLPQGFMLDPASRWRTRDPRMRSIVAQSEENLQRNPDWTGSADIGTPLLGRAEMFSITPVHSGACVVGWVLSNGSAGSDGEELVGTDVEPSSSPALHGLGRIAAVHGGQVLLLDPSEIRYAEANGHAVWLITDAGRVRAATRGIDNVDAELTPCGFLRTHRSYLVNLDRVRRVGHVGRGVLTLSTDPNKDEQIPVSRRSAARIRSLLGL
ncbi:LytTR family transcriptional regulator DNA-binding domain-containing protein [Pseudonocardia sp.]|uniref:LytTR family transcriptional regulator DNA-binding domain-containing protein n=1 Tax=Pseudonocardia sp. TaxID=60912 RepID=UPI002636F3C2|nr:LytTR family transcriptional regulator DNA-binding domain-containing protein [Pseudonocardia sp.]MCW2722766.1 LytTr DNA-binding region [Pseudonocardia sp.]